MKTDQISNIIIYVHIKLHMLSHVIIYDFIHFFSECCLPFLDHPSIKLVPANVRSHSPENTSSTISGRIRAILDRCDGESRLAYITPLTSHARQDSRCERTVNVFSRYTGPGQEAGGVCISPIVKGPSTPGLILSARRYETVRTYRSN